MTMDALLLAGLVVHAKNLLDTVEQSLRNEGLVTAVILHAFERNFADVVTLIQNARDMGRLQRAGLFVAFRQRPKPFGCQLGCETADTPLARGIGLESPLHEWCSIWVKLN
ncbi:hypothetical protein LWC34_27815 [Kibdelosporangium philippinense]|uniref:Uncharacterized protein n=1 Tax=Kibdelosporangium philippinense TaxID=211113 RepID=A0ABS8ZFJ7_9PSEU|nr:hypothetical protein [Kibdelosporangium philippinense]MCE7006608.1 hypothetical protein [Kibdelosporangium philippinense]